MSQKTIPSFRYLKIQISEENSHVIIVSLNRPEKRNGMLIVYFLYIVYFVCFFLLSKKKKRKKESVTAYFQFLYFDSKSHQCLFILS